MSDRQPVVKQNPLMKSIYRNRYVNWLKRMIITEYLFKRLLTRAINKPSNSPKKKKKDNEQFVNIKKKYTNKTEYLRNNNNKSH